MSLITGQSQLAFPVAAPRVFLSGGPRHDAGLIRDRPAGQLIENHVVIGAGQGQALYASMPMLECGRKPTQRCGSYAGVRKVMARNEHQRWASPQGCLHRPWWPPSTVRRRRAGGSGRRQLLRVTVSRAAAKHTTVAERKCTTEIMADDTDSGVGVATGTVGRRPWESYAPACSGADDAVASCRLPLSR